MAEQYDFQRFMTACGGAFLGAIAGAIIGTLVILALDFLHVNAGNTAKLVIALACILVSAAWVAIYEVKKHAVKPA